jgi:phosphatidylinositol 4-kinase
MFLHRLIWALDTELRPAESEFNPKVKRSGWQPPRDTGLWGPCATVKDAVLSSLGPEQRAYFENEHGTFQKVTDISGILKSVPKEQRRDVIAKAARQIAIPRDDLYLPVDPHKRLVSVIPESGTSLQSAAKTPILLAFNVEVLPVEGHEVKAMGGPIVRQSCIFKVGDDCRQDVLALQVCL